MVFYNISFSSKVHQKWNIFQAKLLKSMSRRNGSVRRLNSLENTLLKQT
jgi:hypothetical protein